MPQAALEAWLQRKRTRDATTCAGLALLALVAGLLVLVCTFWFAYGVSWIGWQGVSAIGELVFGQRLRLTHGGRMIGCGVFVLLLFIGQARRSRHEVGNFPRKQYPPYHCGGGGFGSMVMLLAYPQTSSRMIADLLYTGPRLLGGAWGLLRRALRLLRLDTHGCAHLLAFLLSHSSAVSNEALVGAFPGWNLPKLLSQAREVDGVVVLDLTVSLTDELRAELEQLPASVAPG
jgi:hypothetical protein